MNEKIILIAKIYTGNYIEKNIGHEIINFFKPDIGNKYYGYIIHKGTLSEKESYDKIQTILFVSDKKDDKVKILGKVEKDKDNLKFIVNKKAKDKESQKKFIEANNISYGGVNLNEIMDKNGKMNMEYIFHIQLIIFISQKKTIIYFLKIVKNVKIIIIKKLVKI